MKRFFLFCLTALLPLATWAANIADFIVPNDDGVEIYYHITDADARTVETTYTGDSQFTATTYSGDVIIPETVDYGGSTYTVTGVGEYSFYSGVNLGKIEFPETITYIEGYVFYGSDIKEITIPDKVAELENYTFRNCKSLETVVIGSSVSRIGNYCFYDCSALSSITSKNTTPPQILSNVFTNVSTETCTVYVPSQSVELYKTDSSWGKFNIVGYGYSFSVTTSEATDIEGTSATLHGVISAGDETILEKGFEYWIRENDIHKVLAEKVEDVNISTVITGLNKHTTYSFRAFATTESGITYGEKLTFYTRAYDFMVDDIYYSIPNDSKEVEVVWGGSSQSLGTSSYSGNMSIPSSVECGDVTYNVVGIGDHAFYYCRGLEAIEIPGSVTYISEQAFRSCSNLKTVEFLGEGLNSIGGRAFMTCGVTAITLPNSLTTLGDSCFCECSSLPSINIPTRVSIIPECTFENCHSLAEVSFAEGLDSIGYRAFYYCQNLTEIKLPSTVTALGDNIFETCRGITKVSLPDGLLSIGNYTFYVCTNLTDMPLPSSLERIGEGAFWSCAFTEMTIPDKVTRIEYGTFSGCPLVNINLPEGVTYLGDHAFFACANLPSINLPGGLTYIGEEAFANCTSLTEITIPGSVSSIKYQTFYECSSLKKIVLSEGVERLEQKALYNCAVTDVSLPESLTYMEEEAFRFCYDLEEITIPSQITVIVPRTFMQCTSLERVYFPEGLTYIEYDAFTLCYALQQLVLPKNVVAIDDSAFIDSPLMLIYSLNPTPPYCGSYVFSNARSGCTLYVPSESMSSYSVAPTWENFIMTEYAPTDILTLEATDIGVSSATINGSVATGTLSIMQRGFEYWADGTEDDVHTITIDTTVDGNISATLSDLTYGTAYTYRTYAQTAGGTEYGEELTLITEIDAPTVETLVATDVTETSATLNGTVEAGSEEISRKGFVYWVNGSNTMRTILINDDVLSYGLDGLTPYTTYTYRTFATTESATTYGEDVQFFTSADTTGISSISAYDIDGDNVENIYSTNGQQINSMQKGVNIVHFKDGTVRKVYVK